MTFPTKQNEQSEVYFMHYIDIKMIKYKTRLKLFLPVLFVFTLLTQMSRNVKDKNAGNKENVDPYPQFCSPAHFGSEEKA